MWLPKHLNCFFLNIAGLPQLAVGIDSSCKMVLNTKLKFTTPLTSKMPNSFFFPINHLFAKTATVPSPFFSLKVWRLKQPWMLKKWVQLFKWAQHYLKKLKPTYCTPVAIKKSMVGQKSLFVQSCRKLNYVPDHVFTISKKGIVISNGNSIWVAVSVTLT